MDDHTQTVAVQEAKAWFDTNAKINKETPLATNAVNSRSWSEGLNPDWGKPLVYSKDKNVFVEMPLANSAVLFAINRTNGNGITQKDNYTKTSFIVQKDSAGVYRGWLMVLVADTAYVNGDFSKLKRNNYQKHDPAFSGRLMYFDLQGSFLAGWKYDNGLIKKTISLSDYTSSSAQINSTRTKVNLVQTCYSVPITKIKWECITVDFNNSGPQTTCTPHYDVITETQCTVTDGGGGGGGSGGTNPGDNFPPPPKPDCPPVAVAAVDGKHVNLTPGGGGSGGGGGTTPCDPVPPEDPCAQKNKIKNTASNSTISQKNQAILNSTVASGSEYGSDIKISNVNNTSSYMNTPVTTNGQNAAFTPNFTWDSVNGFSICASDGHPGGTAPSPADAVWAYGNLSNANLIASGKIQFYKDNVSVTTNTVNGTYVITVKDWGALQVLYNNFQSNPSAFNANYVQIAQQNNFSAEYALLSIFGNAINVYKALPGTTDFKPLVIDNNNTVNVKPCP